MFQIEEPQMTFRDWIRELWLENCKERFEHGMEPFENPEVYFQTYKWWLKREYKFQKGKVNYHV